MRVIAGKARRIQLKCIEGMDTRPTTDRIKETLFNIIGERMYGCRFLDLFSGSGGIGIEALSRGAEKVCFVENSREAAAYIYDNLKRTRLEDGAEVITMDAAAAIKALSDRGDEPFDVIFMDPPYNQMWEKKVLEALCGTGLADRDTLIIVEAAIDTDVGYMNENGYYIDRIKEYKTNKHIFVYMAYD